MTRQKTIKNSVFVEGAGLQTGVKTKVVFKPAAPESGIIFIRTDLPKNPAVKLQDFVFGSGSLNERRTTIGNAELQVQTVEHMLSALSALAVTNIVIEIDGLELPGLDGSAWGYFDALKKAGIVEQDYPQKVIRVVDPILCEGKNGALLAAFPSEVLRISYTLDYRSSGIGTQYIDVVVNESSFEKELAPARTFCMEEEAMALVKMGLGKGANYDNTLVMNENGPVKNKLRFQNEPVRHKVMDLIGDMYVTGMPISAHIIAAKSGHALNMELVKKLIDAKC